MRKIILTLGAVACAVPALALAAADPKPNSHFSYCKVGNNCPVTFNTNKAGTKIKALNMYDKCSRVPVGDKGVFPAVRVNNGKFSKEGTIENVTGEKVTWEFKGKFKKPKKAVGTYKLTTKDCTDSAHDFVAKRDGPAT
jgi:hypothetical protein